MSPHNLIFRGKASSSTIIYGIFLPESNSLGSETPNEFSSNENAVDRGEILQPPLFFK